MDLIDDYHKTVTFDLLQINADLASKFQKLS